MLSKKKTSKIFLFGALTSKVYAFEYRSWELTTHTSLDCTDNLGTRIRIQKKGKKLVRVLPLSYSEVNFDWISDKTRYIFEGNRNFRLLQSYVRRVDKHYSPVKKHFTSPIPSLVTKILRTRNPNFRVICGKNLDLNSLSLAKYKLFHSLVPGVSVVSETNRFLPSNFPISYQSTCLLPKIHEADFCFTIGLNPRRESTLFNLRLRYRSLQGSFPFIGFGSSINLTYPTKSPGVDGTYLQAFLEGKKNLDALKKTKPILLFGDTLSRRLDASSLYHLSLGTQQRLSQPSWSASFYLSPELNGSGKGFLGFPEAKTFSSAGTFLLGGEEENSFSKTSSQLLLAASTHQNEASSKADLLLPLPTVWEERAKFLTSLGELYETNKDIDSNSTEKYGVFSETFVHPEKLKKRCMSSHHRMCTKLSTLYVQSVGKTKFTSLSTRSVQGKVWKTLLKPVVGEYYCTDSLSKASPTLFKLALNARFDFWSFV